MTAPRWLTIDEACAVVDVSRRTIYNWIRRQKLVTKKTPGGRFRIDPVSLYVVPVPTLEKGPDVHDHD